MQLSQLDWLHKPQTQALLAAFDAAGIPIRFVGGCVRDAVMERPVKDLDAATPATPQTVMALLADAGIKCVPTGLAHGTVTAVIDHQPFEITTLRRDLSCDGRHAEVTFTESWIEDAQRRDFTLNALYCDAQGQITDYTDGIAAARAGRIAFIGSPESRIAEDGLRILRFFRFFATHGQPPASEAALNACHLARHMIDDLSGERIQHEMLRLLAAPDCSSALELMHKFGVLELLFAVPSIPHDRLQHANHLFDAAQLAPDAFLRLALLLRMVEPAQPDHLVLRWRLSTRDGKRLIQLCHTPTLKDDQALLRHLREHGRELYLSLLLRDAAEHGDDPAAFALRYAHAARIAIPVFPLSGADLLAAGFTQGAALGEQLKSLEAYWESESYQPDKAALLARLS